MSERSTALRMCEAEMDLGLLVSLISAIAERIEEIMGHVDPALAAHAVADLARIAFDYLRAIIARLAMEVAAPA